MDYTTKTADIHSIYSIAVVANVYKNKTYTCYTQISWHQHVAKLDISTGFMIKYIVATLHDRNHHIKYKCTGIKIVRITSN